MPASTRAFIKRGGAVCVAAAVLLGGTFTAGAATAAPAQDLEPLSTSSAMASATATPTAANAPSTAAGPEGLAEAVERDLGLTVDEFNKRGALAAKAAEIQIEAGNGAVVSLDGDTINVKTPEPAAAKTAASDSGINIETVSPAPDAATSPETLLADYIAKFGSSKLQSIMRNGAGDFVIRTGNPAAGGPATARFSRSAPDSSLKAFAAQYGNVTVVSASGPATPFIDVVNGQGYAMVSRGRIGLCSIGFNAFNAVGHDAVITAGHCSDDGDATESFLTVPTTDSAAGGSGLAILAPLGKFGASQFGGPNNAPQIPGTDVAVIDVPEEPQTPDLALNLLPKVTNWTTPAEPKAAGPQVTGISHAVVGTPICKSGRTTGWTCGFVEEIGLFAVTGRNYPIDEEKPDLCLPPDGLAIPGCDDIRIVNGFGTTDLEAVYGDSGGSIVSGTTAVGMISAGIPNEITYGVSLTDALSRTAGYSVKLALSAPTINTTAPVYRSGTLTGTVPGAPAGSTVVVTVDGVKTEVPVEADGTWSAKAPNKVGSVTVTATANNGFNISADTTTSVTLLKLPLPAPTIIAPVNEGTVAVPVTAVMGMGTAGATVTLTGDVTGTTLVNEAGHWSVPVSPGLAIGNYTVMAMQTLADWNDSPTTTSAFAVVPAAPAIVSPANGAEFAFNEGPAGISGTNTAGASVVVTVNGTSYNAVVVDTTWSVALNARLGSGTYSVTAVQSVNGIQSVAATFSVVVLAEPAPVPATPAPTPEQTAPAPAPTPEQTQQAQVPAPRDNGMDLANTGTSSTTILLGAAGVLLLLGGAVFLLLRRRGSN